MQFPFATNTHNYIDTTNIANLRIALYQVLAGKFFSFSQDVHFKDGYRTNRVPAKCQRLTDVSWEDVPYRAVTLSGDGLSLHLTCGLYHIDPSIEGAPQTVVFFSKEQIILTQRTDKNDLQILVFSDFEPGAPLVELPEGVEPLELSEICWR